MKEEREGIEGNKKENKIKERIRDRLETIYPNLESPSPLTYLDLRL